MKENSYPSQLIVGELHRKALKFKKENPTLFIDGYVDDPTNYSTQVCPIFPKDIILLFLFSEWKEIVVCMLNFVHHYTSILERLVKN